MSTLAQCSFVQLSITDQRASVLSCCSCQEPQFLMSIAVIVVAHFETDVIEGTIFNVKPGFLKFLSPKKSLMLFFLPFIILYIYMENNV